MTKKAEGTVARVKSYPLLEALVSRRSRRFAKGMALNGGPLAYESQIEPEPLALEEEAALAFAGCGATGPTLAELPYEGGGKKEAGSGNIIINFVGRTVASAEAVHATVLFVMGDGGAWMLKRPQDYPRAAIPDLVRMARDGRFTEFYEKARIKVSGRRPDPPRELPYVLPFNKWSANVPGTTYFLPVAEISGFYINFLLSAFSEEFSTFVVDERNGFKPAGIARFARSKGGHLQDDPKAGRYITIGIVETCLYEFVAIEQGGMLQNLALMGEALGLGGFPHFAAHPFAWFEALGFRMQDIPLSKTIGAGFVTKRSAVSFRPEEEVFGMRESSYGRGSGLGRLLFAAAGVLGGIWIGSRSVNIYDWCTEWTIPAPLPVVYRAMTSRAAVREWWSDMELVDDSEDEDIQVGSTVSFRVHQAPEVAHLAPPFQIHCLYTDVELESRLRETVTGDLSGVLETLFDEQEDGTRITFSWYVRVTNPALNLLGYVAERMYRHSHDHVMESGEKGLSEYCVGRTIAQRRGNAR